MSALSICLSAKCGDIDCCKCDDDFYEHPAARIVAQWQKGFSRGWKWNNAHRHMSTTDRVPLWDDGTCLFSHARPKIPFIIPLSFEGLQRQSIYRIRLIRFNMRSRETERLRMKREWWAHNVSNPEGYRREYLCYRRERSVPGIWLAFALGWGLTFRHVRNYGYCPYIEIADDLEDELARINTAVYAEIRQFFPLVDASLHRPYIIS